MNDLTKRMSITASLATLLGIASLVTSQLDSLANSLKMPLAVSAVNSSVAPVENPVASLVSAETFATGDVFVAGANGKVQWRRPDGQLFRELDTGRGGQMTGMAFDAQGNLYVTSFRTGTIEKFDSKGTLLGTVGERYDGSAESIVFDRTGNALIGGVGSNKVLQYDPQWKLLGSFSVATERLGSDWIELGADQCTLYYTSEGRSIKRYNICANEQMTDFAAVDGSNAFALRLLPSGGLLLADSQKILRLDASGKIIQTYQVEAENKFFALNLDPDGRSFWSADLTTGDVFKFDIGTGRQLLKFNAGSGVGGLAIYREITVVRNVAKPPATPTLRPQSVPTLPVEPVVPQANFTPYLIEPQQATAGRPVRLVAGINLDSPGSLPQSPSMEVRISGQSVTLHDDGRDGDEVAGDGRYSGMVVFTQTGDVPVMIQAASGSVHRSADAMVKVWGDVVYSSGPIDLDLGKLKAGGESCQPLPLDGLQLGQVPFEFRLLQSLPRGHSLTLRASQKQYGVGDAALVLSPSETKQICLETNRRAPSSQGGGQKWVELEIKTAEGKKDLAAIRFRWQVQSLSFWERWGSLILILLAILVISFIVYGYVRPTRFPRELAVTFVPDYEDLDTSPQPLSRWPGVGTGFYRDAKAFLHADFRISGKSKGALAMLKASKQGVWLVPLGASLFREIDLSEWEELSASGRLMRPAVYYRFSDRGPFFRVSSGLGKKPTS